MGEGVTRFLKGHSNYMEGAETGRIKNVSSSITEVSKGGEVSLGTYRTGLEIAAKDYPFYALIQAAMRKADTDNLERLQTLFPWVWEELQARYNAPGGEISAEVCEGIRATERVAKLAPSLAEQREAGLITRIAELENLLSWYREAEGDRKRMEMRGRDGA